MYVECAVLFDDGSIRSSDAQAWVLDCINSATNPDFMVDIAITTRGSQNLACVARLRLDTNSASCTGATAIEGFRVS
jgi:hypothetical protein